ncbi:MAG: DUF4114 domain-containing protein, partial [Anaerolineaceae bacterium]|nr:DUF4114 domain-containing protein [Anaerolineaceae bacterium]
MSTLHNSRTFTAAMVFLLAMASIAGADTLLSTNGDTTYERVYFGYGGPSRENLSALLANYVDPVTGLPDPILRPDGRPLVVGNVDLGEDPAASDQTQLQLFYATEDHDYMLTYQGLGYASYQNIMGVYIYGPGASGPADATHTPLITQGVDAPGSEVVFSVPAGHFFGFYLSSDGNRSERNRFYSENEYNTDGGGTETDHVLMMFTDHGLLIAWEDLPLGSNGKLGDQDY